MPVSNVNYKPRTHVQVRANHAIYMEISRKTGIPLADVLKHGKKILENAKDTTVEAIDKEIDKYVPAATKQLRHSLSHQLHNSQLTNTMLKMNFGTYVKYMKYVANMPSSMTRHPKNVGQRFRYKRKSKHGKRGQFRKNPGAWRFVKYYGPPRWVRLEDPKAQTNFWSGLLLRMKTYLQKAIAEEIRAQLPAGQRKPFSDKLVKGVEKV